MLFLQKKKKKKKLKNLLLLVAPPPGPLASAIFGWGLCPQTSEIAPSLLEIFGNSQG